MKKSFEEWEKETGIFALDISKHDLSKSLTSDEFMGLVQGKLRSDFTGVNYKFRVQWLKDNGYELTRENLLNSDLPTVPKDDK